MSNIIVILLKIATIFIFTICIVITGKAQNQKVIILSVSENEHSSSSLDHILQEFEDQNPELRVQTVSNGNRIIPVPKSASDINEYLNEVAVLVSQADVVRINSDWLSLEATQAGYFLDLGPLVAADHSFDVNEFYTSVWKSFQWDMGLWAFPTSFELLLLLYNHESFDEAGMDYPNGSWTITEFERAIRNLGQTTKPVFSLCCNANTQVLIQSLSNVQTDTNISGNNIPIFNDSGVTNTLQVLKDLNTEGLITQERNLQLPLMLEEFGTLISSSDNNIQGSLIPGNNSGLRVQGFAVSSGTNYPEESYKLTKFLTNYPNLSSRLGTIPARKNLSSDFSMTDEESLLLQQALENAKPISELLFYNYLMPLIIANEELQESLAERLLNIQSEVEFNLNELSTRRAELNIIVSTPLPQLNADSQSDQIQLNFGIISYLTPLPTLSNWGRLAKEFAESDLQIGSVRIETTDTDSVKDLATSYDCFYSPRNLVPNGEIEHLINLDPLLASDPNFEASDIVGNVIMQLTKNNQIWAMPLTLEPNVMWYSVDLFNQAGLPLPQNAWTINEFTSDISDLRDLSTTEESTIVTSYHFPFSNTHILMLIAAYGGLPFDYRVNPPSINFIEPTNIEAIRQVLDLARTGKISYSALSSFPTTSIGGTSASILAPLDDANSRNGELVRMGSGGGEYQMVTYPSGSSFTPISYQVGGAYISSNAQNIEGCYRFISFIAQHPQLFTSMPVRRSQIASDEITISRGIDAINLYKILDEKMQQMNSVEFPADTYSLVRGSYPLHYWLNRAFDKYVLEDFDLVTVLSEAQIYTQAFLDCVKAIEQTSLEDYDHSTYECATKIDPTFTDGGNMQ